MARFRLPTTAIVKQFDGQVVWAPESDSSGFTNVVRYRVQPAR